MITDPFNYFLSIDSFINEVTVFLEMIDLRFKLLTGRTIDQGCGKEHGKLSNEYFCSVAVCQMNHLDMKDIGIHDGDKVKVTTNNGSVILKAYKSNRLQKRGFIFVPYGPWSNVLMSSETGATGMPLLKGHIASVELTNQEVLSVDRLIIQLYGKDNKRGYE